MKSYLHCFLPTLITLSAAWAAPMNVVFIMTDQQNADALSYRMGSQYLKTPALDGLAARGTFFTRAYAANPLCMPSRNAMFTGRYPHETGIIENTDRILDESEFVNMGTYFRRAGYQTAYFGKWHLAYDENKPETHGFDTTNTGPVDDASADGAVEFLSQQHDQPFLLVVSFKNPHDVCNLARGAPLKIDGIGAPPPVDQMPPAPANLAPPKNESDSMTLMRASYHGSKQFPVGDFSPEDWRELRWGYYRLIEKVDEQIGQVLAALRESGQEENTLVVFTSDHGECAGAHGMNQKTVFYEESARVPLIVSAPNERIARTTDLFVNTGVDILPTLLDFARIALPAELPGRSLRVPATGGTVDGWRDEVFVGNFMNQGGIVGDSVPMTQGRMVRTERYKYCVYAYGTQRESLFDLLNDPGETVDLATDPASRPILLEHRERLRQFGIRHHDPIVTELLANDVRPQEFPQVSKPKRASGW